VAERFLDGGESGAVGDEADGVGVPDRVGGLGGVVGPQVPGGQLVGHGGGDFWGQRHGACFAAFASYPQGGVVLLPRGPEDCSPGSGCRCS
jgi:hypothetical protein